MIEQTELLVTEWHYHPPAHFSTDEKIFNFTSLDVMKKRASTKKGIACRLSSRFRIDKTIILVFTAEHSYVIDLQDSIDKSELLKMIRNSFTQFKEKFDLRKTGTLLQETGLSPLDESMIDLDAILPLLI